MAENQTKNYSSYVKEVVQKNFEIFTLKMSFLNQKPTEMDDDPNPILANTR